ncbi:hypothetical protein P7K49_037076 [Saguinus oedipus]|uniref:Uncharacterized protein n=1 Tax=Saguinus oedipus TaxID=9490 RepID=A0ABQ9TM92_SAGOE|nr:hypothetical protein P7K49_037076 [Saguinus oedipus]
MGTPQTITPRMGTPDTPQRHPTNGNPTDGHPTDGHPTDRYPTGRYPTNGQPTGGYPTDDHRTERHPTNTPQSPPRIGTPETSTPQMPHRWALHRHLTDGYPTDGHPTDDHPTDGHRPSPHRHTTDTTQAVTPQTGTPPDGHPRQTAYNNLTDGYTTENTPQTTPQISHRRRTDGYPIDDPPTDTPHRRTPPPFTLSQHWVQRSDELTRWHRAARCSTRAGAGGLREKQRLCGTPKPTAQPLPAPKVARDMVRSLSQTQLGAFRWRSVQGQQLASGWHSELLLLGCPGSEAGVSSHQPPGASQHPHLHLRKTHPPPSTHVGLVLIRKSRPHGRLVGAEATCAQ